MKTRFQKLRLKKGKCFDPLVVEEFDWDNEWADSLHVHPQGGRAVSVTLHGTKLMKYLEHQSHFVAEIY